MPKSSPPLFPLPTQWFSPDSGQPSQSPGGSGPAALTPAIRLATIPDELLLHVVAWLDGRAVLALSETAWHFHSRLADGALACLHLARRISRVVTPSGFATLAAGILQRPGSERGPLASQLAQQRHQLHPSLLAAVQPILDTLMPAARCARLAHQCDMEQWRRQQPLAYQNTIPASLPALQEVLEAPAGERALLLTRWIGVMGQTGVDLLQLADWRVLAAALPPNDEAATLTALLDAHVAGAADAARAAWTGLLCHAIDVAARMAPRHGMHRQRLLAALANALARGQSSDSARDRQRRALWERLLALSAQLPEQGLRPLLGPLARYPTFELQCGSALLAQLDVAVPAWQAMLDTMLPRLPSLDGTTDLLCVLLEAADGASGADAHGHMQLVRALVQRQPALPQAQRSRILHSALQGSMHIDDDDLAPLWDATLLAATPLPPVFQATLLASLASIITDALEQCPLGIPIDARTPAPRWNAVFDRTASLPADLQLVPATALAHAATEIDEVEACVARLLRLATGLPPPDRAALLMAMLAHDYVYASARQWADLVDLVVALPAAVRDTPLGTVAHRLVTQYYTMGEASGDAVGEALRPGNSQLGAWPGSIDDALDLASAALRLLPVRAAGAVLHHLAALNFPYTAAICWTLREIRRFTPADPAYKAVLVTRACAALSQTCHASQLNAVMPDAWQAMLSLPPDQRGSALQFLLDLLRRHHALQAWESSAAKALATLPDSDTPAGDGRKRKSPAS